jgi:hypothetical protein
MTTKSVSINPNPRHKPAADTSALDAFVHGMDASMLAHPAKQPMKRLTFDIPADLHKRIRRACLEKDEDMAVELRRILQEHFPA